jgi:hypothetical protein
MIKPYHAVQFYATDERLFSTVAAFLAEGLIDGQPGLVISTPSHRAGILAQLSARLIDVERARRDGDLLLLDSHEVLDLFMCEGRPDANAFDANIGRFVEQTLQGRPGSTLRAYGDMVNVLWTQGQRDASVQLEMLWNKLGHRFGFSLLCGYAMGSFFKQTSELHLVCAHHTHVFGPDHTSQVVKPTAH